MKSWITLRGDVVRLSLYIQPGARNTEVAGEHGASLKIRLAAPPVDGKANEALIAWLAQRLDQPRRSVILVSGDKNRNKIVDVPALAGIEDILARLGVQ